MPKASLLLVDDDPLILKSLAVVLEREGYTVAQAEGGSRALEMIRESSFKVQCAAAK